MNSIYFPNKIKLAAIELESVFIVKKVNDQIVLDGVDGKLIQCLADKLNFEIEVVLPPDGQIVSSYGNGTFGGIVGMVQRSEADLGIIGLTISERTAGAVDFSIPISALEYVFLTKEPGQMPKISAFAYPFTWNLWILYAFMVLAATILFQRIMFRKATLLGSFLSVLGSIASQAMENVRETTWSRVLFGLWLTIAVVMAFFYKNSVVSFMTMPGKVPVPRTFEELSNAVLSGKYKCLTSKGINDRDILLESVNEYMVKLGEIIEKNNWEYSYEEQFADLLDEPVAIIISKIVTKIYLGSPPYVRVKASEDYLGVWHVAINLRKGFCCRERLNDVLYGIVSGGLYDKWINDIAFRDKLHKRLEVKHEELKLQLTLKDLKMAFFVLFFGYGLAFLTFLAELLIPKYFDIFCS
ncbi:lig_chan-Glu_bd domain-containing protein [Nephila pilipes]|uniref:Lig_chan-Glu_bd domain-containing protein n=1 Tax=Nephila pilipes TaxID=299642 RepID=A0A8X6Q0Y2_NEPPI|nr:lig_chan-Glu_bd domain-containing protein [Nephila pilipes]